MKNVIFLSLWLTISSWNSAFAIDGHCEKAATALIQVPQESGATPHLDALSRQAISFTSPRLILRTPRREDMSSLLPIFNDYLTVRYTWFLLGEGEHWTLDRVRDKYEAFAEQQLQGTRRDFIIQLADSQTIIGRCALYPAKVKGSWEFGITIHQPYWGNRYAEEVMRRIFQYAFTEMGVNEIWFQTESENVQMLRQYERIGIPKVIDAKDDVPGPPLFHRYHQFVLTRERWQQLNLPQAISPIP